MPTGGVAVRVLGLLFLAGVAEIIVLILVGRTIGALPTLGLLLAGGFIGSWLLRLQGRRALREFTEAAMARRPPLRELADGVLIAAGAVLIMVPGFLSDLAGLLCVLPPTRALLRRYLRRVAERRARAVSRRARAAPSAGDYIDGEVVSITEEDDTFQEHRLDTSVDQRRRRHHE
jgi:UPF0716 protein FxsA